jgi:PAS domain S-box-containing protein
MSSMTVSGRWGKLAALATLVAIYVAGAGAVMFAPAHGSVASWWPAAGLAVSLIALAPRSWCPLLAVGIVLFSAAANVTGGRDVDVSLFFGISNAAEAVIAGFLLKSPPDDRPRLESLDDFLRLLRAALAGGLVIATGAALTVVALAGGDFLSTWPQVFASHAASTLVIAPVAMSLRGGTSRRRPLELVAQTIALFAVTVIVFAPDQILPLAFAPLPLLVWAALRHDVRVVAWQLLGVSVMCTILTAEGLGPFGASVADGTTSEATAGTMVQIWLLSAALMSLPLTVAVEQRRQLLATVSAREELFRRNFTESLTGMLLLHPRGDRLEIRDANDAALRLLGEAHGPLIGRYLDRLLENPSAVRSSIAQILAGERDGWHTETGLSVRPGTRVNISVAMLSSGPHPVFAAQLLDVTADHNARVRIEAAEKLTSATLDTTPCIILVTDLAGTVIRVNAAATRLTGFTEDELVGRPAWTNLVVPERVHLVPDMVRDGALLADRSWEIDVRTKHGDPLRMVWNSKSVPDDDGDPAYLVLTGVDVTAERNASGLVTHLVQAAITTALIGIDGRGRITLFNSGAQRLLGHDAADVIGAPFLDLFDPDEMAERTARTAEPNSFAALVADIGPHGESIPRDWTWVGTDGSRHTVSMTLSVAAESPSAHRGFLCVGRDVTEQRHSQEMLMAALETERTAVERLRRLDAAKNEFVSTVSHELRTPVSSIVGYTEMLKDGSIVDPLEHQLPMLEKIARNGERLITICNDLLVLGNLDTGTAPLDREQVDLGSMLDHVEDSMRALLNGRRLDVEFQRPAGPVEVVGDRIQLERALTNLLSNAVKFTEDGGRVRCRLERHHEEALVVVHDTGIGIPVDEQASLFEKFFRSSTAQQRAIQGTGLGLSIVAGIVASHGGRIGVESAHLEGTTFTVRLPLKAS